MNKTTTIHLQGTVFVLEEEAYVILKAYLDHIDAHFAASPDKQEIIGDIEQSIAEKWSTQFDVKTGVVTKQMVEEMIAILGTVEQFDQSDAQAADEAPKESSTKKRLYRNTDDAIIAGVASGLATYLGLDPVILRIAFVLLTVFGGSGILVYIILWLIIPAAKTSLQRSEMTGRPMNLETVVAQAKSVLNKDTLQSTRDVIVQVLSKVGRMIAFIFALVCIIVSIIGLVAISIGALSLILNHATWFAEPSLIVFAPLSQFLFLLIALFLTLFIPLLTILLLGVRIIRKRSIFQAPVLVTGIVAWVTAMITAGALLITIVPKVDSYYAEQHPQITKSDYALTDFSVLDIADNYRVQITTGDEYQVDVTAAEDEFESISLIQSGNELEIKRLAFSTVPDGICFWCERSRPTIAITMPKVDSITAQDTVRVIVDRIAGEALTLNLSDVASVMVEEVVVNTLTAQVVDAARLELVGSVETANLTSKDAGRILAADTVIQIVTVSAADSSRINLHVEQELNGKVRDVARVHYEGDPLLDVEEDDIARISPVSPLE